MAQQQGLQRPDPRPEMRADPRDETKRERKRKGDVDPFYFDPDKVPAGMTYEWKRYSVNGEVDVSHQIHMGENAWDAVPADRHPEYMPPGHKGAIERSGMVLMERPAYLTEEARREERQNARATVQNNEAMLAQTPDDTLTREHPQTRARISRTLEARVVPE